MKNKASEVKAHAKFSASGSERWLNCPGSIALSERAPPQPESPYALEGTKAHACLEFMVKNHKTPAKAKLMALKKWPAEMVLHAEAALDHVMTRLSKYPDVELLSEVKVDATPFTCEGQFGTLDIALVEEFGRLTVIDYKYGAGVLVDPEENTQLIYYALALSYQYDHNFHDVEIVVIQPRAYSESGDTIRSWTISMEELLKWAPRFREGVERALDPLAPLKSGDHCRWCPAAVLCPELKNRAMEEAAIVFSEELGVESVPEPTQLAVKNLGVALTACDKLDAWIGKVREHAQHVLERGGEIEGWKLVEKRSIRKWTNEEMVALDAAKLFGSKAFTKPELLTPAQLEKKLGDKAFDFTAKYTTSKSSGTTLVPESDKRPAFKAIEAVFEAIEESALPPSAPTIEKKLNKRRPTPKGKKHVKRKNAR